MKRQNEEHQIQAAFFARLGLAEIKHPELKLIYAVPNGGNRNVITATFLKREGVKKGVADVCIPIARKSCHGAYMEFKAGKNKLTPVQNDFLNGVAEQGYEIRAVWTIDQAVEFVKEYLGIDI